MKAKTVLIAILFCFLAVWLLGVLPHGAKVDAASGDSTVGGDRSFAEKKGIGGLLKGKGYLTDPRAPSKTQMYIGLGSIVVMIIVVKYL